MLRRNLTVCVAALFALGACSDPLESVPRLQDVDLAENAGQAEALANPDAQSVAEAPDVELAEAEKPNSGFLGFLRNRADRAQQVAPEADANTVPEPAQTEQAPVLAALPAEATPSPEPVAEPSPTRRRGLFGGGGGNTRAASGRAPKPGAPDYQQVGPGTTLPYGQIARLCGVSANKLGKQVDRFPEKGRGYMLYDTAPGATGQRSFFITGFDDGCARQFSAALVLFAPVSSYEQLHYGPAGKTLPKAETDAAYERVKSKVCRVGAGKPCGNRLDRLAKNTVFVTIYEQFGSSPRWKNLLLHDGSVEALDINSR